MDSPGASQVPPKRTYGAAELEHQLALLGQVGTVFARDVDADPMRAHALQAAVEGTYARGGVVLIYDRSANVYWGTAPAVGWTEEEALRLSIGADEAGPVEAVYSGDAAAYIFPSGDDVPAPSVVKRAGARTALLLPVRSGKDVVGVMCLTDKDPAFAGFNDLDVAFVNIVLTQLAATLRPIRLRDHRARRGSDKAGALFAKADFDDIVTMEMQRAEQLRYQLGCVVLEITNVGEMLKKHGPDAVDTAIAVCAETIRRNMRHTDILTRYDESTVALLMPGTDGEGSQIVARRVAAELESLVVPKAGRAEVRCGTSSYPEPATTGHELVALALRQVRG